jgi:hypothetical protein
MVVVCYVALLVIVTRQAVVIAEHGLVGWLQAEDGPQTEWEVRASILAVTLLVAVVVGLIWRAGDGVADRIYVIRMVRAVRRERRAAAQARRGDTPVR